MLLGPLVAPGAVLERAGPRVLDGRKQARLLQQLAGVGLFEGATRPVRVEPDQAPGQSEQQECGQQEAAAHRGGTPRGRFAGRFGRFVLLRGDFVLHLLREWRGREKKLI